jgi:anti-anti-sigma regulatory factor
MLLANAEHVPVSFSGDVTISNIEAAHADLGAALRQDGPVVIDVSGVTETDLTFVQLIESARRKAAEAGCDFTLRHPADGAVLEVLRRGGFLDDDTSDRAKFWLQEAAQ